MQRIEQSPHDSVPVRVLTGDTHPDHDTICTFRRENKELLTESFVKVLELAQQLKVLQVGQITVAVDGTKVLGNASKHSAVSYERAGQMIRQLALEVQPLVAKVEQADSTPLLDGLTIPEEIARRQERQAARAQARYAAELAELAEHEKKLAERAARQARGQRVGGKPPQPPTATPGGTDQYDFTDADSRIMKAGNGDHFEQSYNAQAAVEVTSRLIVGQRLSQSANDKQELVAELQAIPAVVGTVAAALVASGFYSEQAVQTAECNGDPQIYAALERKAIIGAWPIWSAHPNRRSRQPEPVWAKS